MSAATAPAVPTAPASPSTPLARAGTSAGRAVRLGGASAASVATRRWRRMWLPLLVVTVLLLTALIAAMTRPEVSGEPLAADNPNPDGARAVLQVLGDQGVTVTELRSVQAAVDRAKAGTTLALVAPYGLDAADLASLAAVPADLVIIDADDDTLAALTDGLVHDAYWGADAPLRAECTDPDAQAAGVIGPTQYAVEVTDAAATVCFPEPVSGTYPGGVYAVVEQGGRTIRVLADSAILTNDQVATQGNAALALRMLGHHDRLTWFRPPAPDAVGPVAGPGIGDLLPPQTGAVVAALAFVVLVTALWRGRAFGRVVSEPLPVTVRAAEATRGRGRLYRRARTRGHAAAALRAAAARRSAQRLGLPRSADAPTVIEALATASGRPTHEVAALLYGPPPSDDAELLALSRALDQLESEVHRP